jgi:hypothetical protein
MSKIDYAKWQARSNIRYLLKQLLEHKDNILSSNAVDIEGRLYKDVVKDIEHYLEICNKPDYRPWQ